MFEGHTRPVQTAPVWIFFGTLEAIWRNTSVPRNSGWESLLWKMKPNLDAVEVLGGGTRGAPLSRVHP